MSADAHRNGKFFLESTMWHDFQFLIPFRIRHFDRKRTFEQFKKRMEKGLDPIQQKEYEERQRQQQKQ